MSASLDAPGRVHDDFHDNTPKQEGLGCDSFHEPWSRVRGAMFKIN